MFVFKGPFLMPSALGLGELGVPLVPVGSCLQPCCGSACLLTLGAAWGLGNSSHPVSFFSLGNGERQLCPVEQMKRCMARLGSTVMGKRESSGSGSVSMFTHLMAFWCQAPHVPIHSTHVWHQWVSLCRASAGKGPGSVFDLLCSWVQEQVQLPRVPSLERPTAGHLSPLVLCVSTRKHIIRCGQKVRQRFFFLSSNDFHVIMCLVCVLQKKEASLSSRSYGRELHLKFCF